MSLESLVLSNLIFNESYVRQVLPYLREDYFSTKPEKVVYTTIDNYIKKYNTSPSIEALVIELDSASGLTEELHKQALSLLTGLKADEKTDLTWLVDQTEKFCQDRAIFNAIMQSISIVESENKNGLSRGSIPELLTQALSVSFDDSLGHDYFEDWEARYDSYNRVENKLPFDIEILNRITNGGLNNKTLTILMAGPYVGKSLFMCHMAANNLYEGKNVLYISMELSEEMVTKRIDANLFDLPIDQLERLPKQLFGKKIEQLKGKTRGQLIVHEYPAAGASAANFRHLLNELRIKKNFKPAVIYVDYINICSSSRLRHGSNVNMYQYIKSIAEELRGLATEFDLPIVTATQVNRDGFRSSDLDMGDVAESFGLAATADVMLALIVTDELKALGQIMVKQLKNRLGDADKFKKFMIGVERPKFKLLNVDQDFTDGEEPPPTKASDKFNKFGSLH